MKRVAYAALIVMATLTLLALVWQLRQAAVLFFLSIATASAFRPLIDWLKSRGLGRGGALLAAYLSVLALAGGLVWLASRPLMLDLQNATNQATIYYDTIKTTWPSGSPMQRAVAEQLPTPGDLARLAFGGDAVQSFQTLAGLGGALGGFAANLALILILSVYWSADYLRFERLWLAMLAPEARPQARETFRAIVASVGAYIRSEAIQSVLAGLLLWASYQALGMRYAALMAALAALAWLIPWFGAAFAILPPLLVGLAQGGPALAGLAAAYTLLVLFVQERVIEPRFFRGEAYSSVILVVMILALATEFGLVGLILAPLASAAAQITLRYLLRPPGAAAIPAGAEAAEASREIQRLEAQIREIEAALEGSGAEPAIDLQSKIKRLKKLAAEARRYVEGSRER